MKQLSTLREFKKVSRKYWKRHAKVSRFYSDTVGKKVTYYWTDKDFCFYHINNLEELDNNKIKDCFQYDISSEDYDLYKSEWKNLFNKDIIATNIFSNEIITGTFFGFVATNRTIYYAIKENGHDNYTLVLLSYKIKEKNEN